MGQDRFFAWADPKLIDQIELTRSYKQIQFGEANTQLTFHENNRLDVDGVSCLMVARFVADEGRITTGVSAAKTASRK